VAGKARVHELAKELGVTSKEVLARLSEQGEFVKSASSTVEAPVARRGRALFASHDDGLDLERDAVGFRGKTQPHREPRHLRIVARRRAVQAA